MILFGKNYFTMIRLNAQVCVDRAEDANCCDQQSLAAYAEF